MNRILMGKRPVLAEILPKRALPAPFAYEEVSFVMPRERFVEAILD